MRRAARGISERIPECRGSWRAPFARIVTEARCPPRMKDEGGRMTPSFAGERKRGAVALHSSLILHPSSFEYNGSMSSIRVLPDLLISQIAAGEVVERPASALKELLENSLDAGATAISVQLAGGGTSLIKVVDDGRGIAREDLRLALARHATSKIASLGDLEQVGSLGFRGEALASITSVARVALVSRREGDKHAWSVSAHGAEISTAEPAALAGGTSIEARDLYFNTPARRKFLKSEATEYAHCDETFKRTALSRCDSAFTLQHNGRARWHMKAHSVDERIAALLGDDFAASALALDVQAGAVRLH